MSCRENEEGRFYFKKPGFNKVMKELRVFIQAWNEYQYNSAIAIYNGLIENKIKKNKDAVTLFLLKDEREDFHHKHSEIMKTLNFPFIKNDFNFRIDVTTAELALKEMFRGKPNTLLKPRRSAYPKLTNKDREFYCCFSEIIEISCKDNVVNWSVIQGNRSVDESIGHFAEKFFFKVLTDYEWKAKEGGSTISYSENFEYNEHDYKSDEEEYIENTTRVFKKFTTKEKELMKLKQYDRIHVPR